MLWGGVRFALLCRGPGGKNTLWVKRLVVVVVVVVFRGSSDEAPTSSGTLKGGAESNGLTLTKKIPNKLITPPAAI